MGQPKSSLMIEGATLAERSRDQLLLVCEFVIEVGPGVSGLPSVLEYPRGEGPLVAIAAGREALRAVGHEGSAIVLACDLPFVSERLLHLLVDWDSPNSVIPVVHGAPQTLCAKWGRGDLDRSQELVDDGCRSLQHVVTQRDVVLIGESVWSREAEEREFSDVDSPSDLIHLGLTAQFA